MLRVMNTNLTTGVVPPCLKHAVITLVIKKHGSDNNVLKNYRPVSNLPFLSKVIYRRWCRLNSPNTLLLTTYTIHCSLGTAQRQRFSRSKIDIDRGLNRGERTLLVLPDLSAAFDTVDHDSLLSRLRGVVGIRGSAVHWLKSYLSERTQCVTIDGIISTAANLGIGVPQGSVLGPLFFRIYILPLQAIVREHEVARHLGYSDDCQLYTSFHTQDKTGYLHALHCLEACPRDVRMWMVANKLKLNADKTEFMVINSQHYHTLYQQVGPVAYTGGEVVKATTALQNLGVTFDPTMVMLAQISSIERSAYYHLPSVSKIRHCLDRDTCIKAMFSLVMSRLDYANALLAGQLQATLRRLQMAWNYAVRVITGLGRQEHVSPLLANYACSVSTSGLR